MPWLEILFWILWPWLGLFFWKVVVGLEYGEWKSFGIML